MQRKSVGIALGLLVGLMVLIFATTMLIQQRAEELRLRTPIPESTIRAYSPRLPITDRVQAVIAARLFLGGTRLESLQPPEVLFVEQMTLSEVKKRAERPGEQSYEGIPLDTPVWFIIFKGVWRIHPPDPLHTITPPPPFQDCQYVRLPVNIDGFRATGGIDCPETK